MKVKANHQNNDPEDYIGNIWGWKFSFISLAIILFFLGLMLFRFWTVAPEHRQLPDRIDTMSQKLVDTFNQDNVKE